MATKPVTVEQWQRFQKDRPEVKQMDTRRYSPDAKGPIIRVTFYEALQYCNWLSEKEGIPREQWCYPAKIEEGMKPYPDSLKRTGYRLPKEAEWEFACQAGATSSRYYGTPAELLPRYAWFIANSQDQAWPVGQKRPNDLGLFDMLGNVWTWCQDPAFLYPAGGRIEDKEDVRDISDRINRTLRGGSFFNDAPFVRSAYRVSYFGPAFRSISVGLRVCRTW